ncbi:MAG: stage IV sporulation protein A [Ruminococcaceae bacterium]|nr:stage IV sporulation protein A [Oscillospiraceae bacterium]
MEAQKIYRDIAGRTGGDVYIGVVGPVRSGKSTFIKSFMETAVIPNISGTYDQKKARDELPQSADGKTVMTAEPKFIPDEAIDVSFGEGAGMKIRMIDCVGYLIPDALGMTEDGEERMVKTPWSDEAIPFEKAAEQGTEKVIREHSTVAMLVTCDGTFGDIQRENYIAAEERVVNELKEIGKPFVLILNSKDPDSPEAESLAMSLEEKYKCPVALVNCLSLDNGDIESILEMLLYEFPVTEIKVSLPKWICALPNDYSLYSTVIESIKKSSGGVKHLSDVRAFTDMLSNELSKKICEETGERGTTVSIRSCDLSNGKAQIDVSLPDALYYNIICDLTGLCISDPSQLISVLLDLNAAQKELEKYKEAIEQLDEDGYGIVMPKMQNLILEEPEIIKTAGSYGVCLKAKAQSVHMIRADIETEISPIVGTQEQADEIIRRLIAEYEDDPQKLWESNIFGKSLYELVNDGLHTKIAHLSKESREKLSETLSRIVNESSNGLICILV